MPEKGEAERKSLGAYYTPPALARRLVRWAVRRSTRSVLDPACGDGVFLREARRRLDSLGTRAALIGIDIDPDACRTARTVPGVRILRADFLSTQTDRVDCVLGNPPYIRYQRFADRHRVRRRLEEEGLHVSGLASSWACFALLAARRLRPNGRMALVIPREALFSNYGRKVLDELTRLFERVRVDPLEPLWFDGALQKVACLRCENPRPVPGRVRRPRPWRWDRLSRAEQEAFRCLRERFISLSDLAWIRLGIVTGDKRFFAPTREEIVRWRIPSRVLVPAVTSPGQLQGCRFLTADVRALDRAGRRVHLLAGPFPPYLREGVRRGVHRRYKCRIRRPWYALPLGRPPDGFLGYLIHDVPRMAANEAGAYATNNLHAVTLKPGVGRSLFAAFHNPVTRLGIELIGRVYGGGVLKIEPGDADRIPVPRPGPAPFLEARVDRALRKGGDVCGLAIRWLHECLELPLGPLEKTAAAADRLSRERRENRTLTSVDRLK